MAIIHLGNQRYEGLTADTKPTNVVAGALYRDTQLDITYEYNGSSWDKITSNVVTIKDLLFFSSSGTTVSTGVGRSMAWGGTSLQSATQGAYANALDEAFTVKKIRVLISANAKTGDTTLRLYKDSTELRTITIPAGSTTAIDTGTITHAFTSSEKLDMVYDSSAGGAALSITFSVLVYIEKTVNLT